MLKIFNYLDDEKTGYLSWEKFMEGMKIVFATSAEDKVDLFLRMVDEDGGGTFGFEEIKEICMLTFETKKSSKVEYDKNGNPEPDIMEQTA